MSIARPCCKEAGCNCCNCADSVSFDESDSIQIADTIPVNPLDPPSTTLTGVSTCYEHIAAFATSSRIKTTASGSLDGPAFGSVPTFEIVLDGLGEDNTITIRRVSFGAIPAAQIISNRFGSQDIFLQVNQILNFDVMIEVEHSRSYGPPTLDQDTCLFRSEFSEFYTFTLDLVIPYIDFSGQPQTFTISESLVLPITGIFELDCTSPFVLQSERIESRVDSSGPYTGETEYESNTQFSPGAGVMPCTGPGSQIQNLTNFLGL